jgi:hypothetical protein
MKGPSEVVGIGFVNPYVTLEVKVLSGPTLQSVGTSPISAGSVCATLSLAMPKPVQVCKDDRIQLCRGRLMLT